MRLNRVLEHGIMIKRKQEAIAQNHMEGVVNKKKHRYVETELSLVSIVRM